MLSVIYYKIIFKMEGSVIPILESFPLISKVMPYYGFTHRMFLVLSILSKHTRSILMKYYKEFRRFMLEYSLEKEVTIENLSHLHLPSDLFKFRIKAITLYNKIDLLFNFIDTVI